MEIKKVVLAIAAQNLAGKTTFAQKLKAHYHATHYSVREYIRERYEKIYQTEIENKDTAFHDFGEAMKREYGPHVFLEGIITRFVPSPFQVCVIESLRAPGEALWLLTEQFKQTYPAVLPILIGIDAPYSDRMRRFLEDGRADEITDRTALKFKQREKLVNSGIKPWEENVEKTLKHTKVFSNPDSKQEEVTLHEMIEHIDWSMRYGM